jgi:hypothetical protein
MGPRIREDDGVVARYEKRPCSFTLDGLVAQAYSLT